MKRLALLVLIAFSCVLAVAASTPNAQAALFGAKKGGTPSPSPSPSALPTASPEPPSIAIPRLQAKLKANPTDQLTMAQLAAEYLQVNRPDITLQYTQHLLQMGDKTAQVYYYDGFAYEQLGNMTAATYDLEQASNLDPTNFGVLAQLTDVYLKENRFADAERIAKRAVTFNKNESAAIDTLGSDYAAEQHYDDARAQFEAAYALDPKDTSPLFQIATTYAQQDNIPMAVQTVGRALAVNPRDVQALVFKADLYARQHDDAHAVQAYDDAVVAAPTDDQKVAIMVRKASYFISEKKDSQGVAILQQAVTQYPKVAPGFVALGNYYASAKQFDKANTQWQAALALDPSNAQALLGLGEVALQTGRVTDGITYLKRYTQVQPDAQGFALLGQAYSRVHDYSGAREACGKSFEIQRSPITLSCVAGADFELKNYKEAAQIFDALDKAAKGFLDNSPELLFIAAKSYAGSNQCTKAATAYKRLLALKGWNKNSKGYADVRKAASEPCHSSEKHSG
ncbi:MAG: tetratricopeptide repeat protein [Candidatus Eremiobacteraeota bacterium]|nr:tetratricopeptide repeat protein [Candidatus Eremiobacteraeota bacterium]